VASLPFPVIDPPIFEIGPFTVRWYGLAYVAGFLVAGLVIRWLNKRWKVGLSDDDILTVILYAIIGILAGSRIGWVLIYGGTTVLEDPLRLFAMWEGGMSWHGGFVGLLIAGWFVSRRLKVPFGTLADMVAVGVPAGLFFGRVANFINAELWGRPTDLPWGMVFPGAGLMPRHPSQLYEAFLQGIVIMVILMALSLAKRPQGFYYGLFMVLYGTFRTLVEFVREPDPHIGLLFGALTMGQVLSIPLIIAGAVIVYRALRKTSPA